MQNIMAMKRKGKLLLILCGLLVSAIVILLNGDMPRLSENLLISNRPIRKSNLLNQTNIDYAKQSQYHKQLTSSKRRPAGLFKNHTVCSGQRSPYITVCFKSNDQLGNQMFQYASTFCFSKLNNFRLLVDKTKDISKTYELSAIQIDPLELDKACNEGERLKQFVITKFDRRVLHFSCSKNITINGYMQSYANFKECTADIKREFAFQNHDLLRSKAEDLIFKSTKYRYIFNNMDGNNILLIAIHARRGDYVRKFLPKAHKQYFIEAMDHFRVKYGRKCVFVVMTNADSASRRWCNDNIVRNSTNTYLLNADDASVHLYVLSHSDHVIISMGSFGWWGAFLNQNATVVKWNVFHKSKKHNHAEFYPSNWILMEGDRLGRTINDRWWGGM